MMTIREIVKRTEKLVADNSPVILTAIGVTGTITTAFLTTKATFKAAEIFYAELPFDENVTAREKFEMVWSLYIPAVSVGTITIVSIIGANRIGNRRAAAIAAAYSISERAFVEYKEKVVEKLGENKEREVRDELAQDRANRNPVSEREVIIAGSGDVLCYEHYTGRYFTSSMEAIKKAMNDTNYRVLNDCYASLTDFYNALGIPSTTYSDDIGWSSSKLLEIEFSTILSDDGRPCISIDYRTIPIRDYYKVH